MNTMELINRNAHIPTDEIAADIAITEAEIVNMEREAEHLEATPMTSNDAKWNHIRANARRHGIQERKEFITNLKIILEARTPKPKGPNEKSTPIPAAPAVTGGADPNHP